MKVDIVALISLFLIIGFFVSFGYYIAYASKPQLPPTQEFDEERHQNYQTQQLSSFFLVLTFVLLLILAFFTFPFGETRYTNILRRFNEATRRSFSSVK